MNIAEGTGLSSKAEFRRTLYIARGSLKELEYQIFLATELGYLEEAQERQLNECIQAVGKLVGGLINKINTGS